MQKRPPILLCSAIAGAAIGVIVYWLAAPPARRQSDAFDRELKKFEPLKLAPVTRQPSRASQPPSVIESPAIASSAHPKLLFPDLTPTIEPAPLASEYPIVERHSLRSTATVPTSESPRLPKRENSVVDEEELPLAAQEERGAESKEDEPARVARKFLTLSIAKRAKSLGKKPVRYVAPWVKTELSSDKQTAIVFFDARGKSPDCDVHLRFDSVRKKWNVSYIRGGGFGNLMPDTR